MKTNDEVVLLNDEQYVTDTTRKTMTIQRGSIGRVLKARDSQSFYVKFRGHQNRAFHDFELVKLIK